MARDSPTDRAKPCTCSGARRVTVPLVGLATIATDPAELG